MAQKQNRRAKIVGTDIELDITEKEEVIVESHDDDHDHDHHHKETFITKYIFSIDHKMISKQYLITGLIMGIVGIAMSLLFRLQLAWPEESFGIFDVLVHPVPLGLQLCCCFAQALLTVSHWPQLSG